MRRIATMIVCTVAVFLGGAVGVWAQKTDDVPDLPPELKAQLEATQKGSESKAAAEAKADAEKESKVPVFKPKTWEEIVEQWMTPIKILKSKIVRIDEHHAYPHAAVPFKMEIVKEEGDYVWLKGLPPEDPESALHPMWLQREANQTELKIKEEYEEKLGSGAYLDFSRPDVPAPTVSAVDFVSAGQGLPTAGKWQMGIDLADMNGDGLTDIIVPPQRLGRVHHPAIYLGDGKGGFSYWDAAKWNPQIHFDYGDVKVADFDQDGYLDLVIAVHFGSQYVMYGSANHEFRRFDKLPSPDPRITSRAVTVGDFDGDGRPDVAFLAELDLDMAQTKRLRDSPTVWIVKNTPQGWKLDNDYPAEFVIGDVIRSADVDSDGHQDLIIASNSKGWRAIVLFNRGKDDAGEKWWPTLDERHVLGNGFHFGVDFVSGSDQRSPVLYAVFEQFMRVKGEQSGRTGIVRYEPLNDDWSEIKYTPVFFDSDRYDPFFRVAAGDLDGDGLEDLVVSRKGGSLEVWIQTADGNFYRDNTTAFADARGRAYDIKIEDLDGDGNGDIICAMADMDKDSPGGVRVWLSRPRG